MVDMRVQRRLNQRRPREGNAMIDKTLTFLLFLVPLLGLANAYISASDHDRR